MSKQVNRDDPGALPICHDGVPDGEQDGGQEFVLLESLERTCKNWRKKEILHPPGTSLRVQGRTRGCVSFGDIEGRPALQSCTHAGEHDRKSRDLRCTHKALPAGVRDKTDGTCEPSTAMYPACSYGKVSMRWQHARNSPAPDSIPNHAGPGERGSKQTRYCAVFEGELNLK